MSIEQIMGMAAEQVKWMRSQQPKVILPVEQEKPTKRRNLTRWRENRMRRMDFQINRFSKGRTEEDLATWPEFQRLLNRGSQLANQVQIDWANRKKNKK